MRSQYKSYHSIVKLIRRILLNTSNRMTKVNEDVAQFNLSHCVDATKHGIASIPSGQKVRPIWFVALQCVPNNLTLFIVCQIFLQAISHGNLLLSVVHVVFYFAFDIQALLSQ